MNPEDKAPHQEVEVKLRVDPEKLARVRRSRWWRELGPVRRQSLHSSYFDTHDHDLREHDITLRTRSDGKRIVQTVKIKQDTSDPVLRREWETLIPDPVPDPSLVIDPALPHAFRQLTSADLHSVFHIDTRRETRRLETERVQIDISLDEGTAISGPDREPIHEIELELVTGNLRELFAEARRLSDSVDGRLHARTKADVGYGLILPDRRNWSRAPKLCLSPDMTTGQSFQRIVLNALSHLTANDDCARLNLHVEGVHQCRIALRRLRSALKIYGPGLRSHIEKIDGDVRWLGKILGVARDLDVLQTELIAPAMESLGEGEDLAPLLANLNGKKAAAYAQVGEALGSERYRHLLIDLCALGHSSDLAKSGSGQADLGRPLAEFAAAALSRLHKRLLKRGRGFETLSEADRHRVRIALKRLRYAVDFFGDVFDSGSEKKFFKRLARLQDHLGGMNDVAVAETMLMRLIGVQLDDGPEPAAPKAADGRLVFAAGTILGWHRRRAVELDRQVVKDWHSFVRAKPFWPRGENAPA